MGWVADARLVAATTNAGGFGFLAAATMTTDTLREQIAVVRSACDGKFGVNFHMFQPNARDVIELVLENADRIRAVSYGRGPDAKTRSEEHTSELQYLMRNSYDGFCLKKKKTK